MDGWQELIEGYQDKEDPKTFSKLLHSAEVLVNDDLTTFEVEYLLSTLLFKPVNLLQTVRDKWSREQWDKSTTDALKLLSALVSRYDNIDVYYEDIISLCLLHFDAKTRQLALTCLTNLVRKSVAGARDYNRHINALEETNTCKAPLALLIGAICEYHPEVVSEDINKIWRVFLNLLDCNKNTVSVKKAVLQGILSLFKHFGVELTTIELDCFYEKLVVFVKTPRCEDVCLSIFQNYSHLFRERISKDISTRKHLWGLLYNNGGRDAIIAVYTAVANTVSESKIKDIITELQEHAKSKRFQEKFAALHALTCIHTVWGLGDLDEYIDIHMLEFEIRNGNINYEICDAVIWCVKSKLLYSDRLLETSLLFYDTFPAVKRRELLNSMLQADEEIKKSAIMFLTNYPQSMVWRDIFDDKENANWDTKCVVEYALEYIAMVLTAGEEQLMTQNDGVLPDPIKGFASLLTLLPPQGSIRILERYARMYAEFVPAYFLFGNNKGSEDISIKYCINDDDKLRCCLSYIDMLEGYKLSEMIIALETILSKNNIEATHLRRALHRLKQLIQGKELNKNELSQMLRKIQIISKRINKSKKEDRMLERDIIMFIAKYGRTIEDITPNYYEFAENLENTLVLEVDDDLKLKLRRVLTAAIEYEDEDALKMLLNVITAKLAIKNDPTLQKAVLSLIVALSRCDVTWDVEAHSWATEDVVELLEYIITETSSKSRNILLSMLEKMLNKDEGDLLEKVLESLLLEEHNYCIDQAILEVLGLLIKLLQTDNLLSKKFLPHIIIRVLKTKKYNVKIFKMAADMFTDKIELFDGSTVDGIFVNIFNVLNSMRNEEIILNIKMAMCLMEKICDLKKHNKDIIEYYFDGKRKINLLILIEIKCAFSFDYEKCQEMLMKNNFLQEFFQSYDKDYSENGVVFDFVSVFAENLLNYNSNETYRLLSRVIEDLTPQQNISKKLSACISQLKSYDEIKYTTHLSQALKIFIKKYPFEEITENIQKYSFKKNHEILVSDLAKCDFAETFLMEFTCIKKWVEWILELHESGFIERNLKNKMAYLMDLVDLSLRFFTQDDLKDLLLKDKNDECMKFFRTFMRVSYKYFIRKPYVLLTPGLEHSSVLLIDIVRSTRDDQLKEVLELAEKLWPTFCNVSSWEQKLRLWTSLPVLPDNIEKCIWKRIDENNLNIVNKIEMVMATRRHISSIYKKLCPHLPARLSELSGTSASCFRVLLDILASNNVDLVSVVAEIAANDDTKGWWDDALQMCMSLLVREAKISGPTHLSKVYSSCLETRGHSTSRLLLPLLRYSTPAYCEDFFSTILEDLLFTLKVQSRASPGHYSYDKCVEDYVRALNIIEVIFEKVPKENIDSSSSLLYSKTEGATTPFYLVKNVCKFCVTLFKVDDRYRLFHRANYNCLVAAICLRDPSPAIYRILFDPKVWVKLIDKEEIQLPIREQWNYRMIRHSAPNLVTEVSLRAGSVKTRMFTRTLSESPFLYDLSDEHADVVEPQEIQVKDSPLNRHQCMAAFKALFNKENAIRDEQCRNNLENALKNDETPVNVKWLLAQAICNSKDELKAYASTFQPALLAVIISTIKNNKLNDLHVDILDCIISWKESTNVNNNDVNKIIDYIINTAIDYRGRKNIYYSLIDRLVKLLDIWQNAVIPWTNFERHFAEKDPDILKICINILKNIAKCNKYVPELLPDLTRAIEEKNFFIEIYELFGMALKLEKNNREYLKRFQEVLASLRRTNVMEYIKLLYYTQKGYPMVCEQNNIRVITDLVPKLANGREKLKCLQILDTFVRNARDSDDVTVLFDTISLKEYLQTVEGLSLAKNGLHLMSERDREAIVTIVLKESYTKQMLSHAADFLTEVVKLHLASDNEPQAKRPARESNSKLLCNTFIRNILQVLSKWGEVNGLNEVLDENLNIRFYESFYIAIVFSKLKSETNLYKMLKLFFQGMISVGSENEGVLKGTSTSVKETTLEPPTDPSKMTKNDTIQSLLKFCQKNLQVAVSVTIELLKTYSESPRFEFVGDDIVNLLRDATPWLIEVLRAANIWECYSLQPVLEELMTKSIGTEGEDLTKLLYEEFKLHRFGAEQFVLGLNTNIDKNMPEVSTQFSIDDLIFAFGKLSNWDDLTIQQKNNIKNELPCLWTTSDNFEQSVLKMDFEGPMWLNAMVSTYKQDNTFTIPHNVYKWPRNYFDVSVMAEISTWNEIRDAVDIKNIVFNDIQPSDCMAQWSARLLMRSLYLHSQCQHDDEQALSLSRSHAAAWCVRASEMALHAQVLHCCKTVTGLHENELLQWFRFKLLALRAIGLEKNDRSSLEKALNLADAYVPQFLEMSTAEDITGIRLATIQLRNDLKTLEKNHIKDVLKEIDSLSKNKSGMSRNYKKDLEKICILGMTFFDQSESEEHLENKRADCEDEILIQMADILNFYVQMDLGDKNNLLADVIINRLDGYRFGKMSKIAAEKILNSLQPIINDLNYISIDHLTSHIRLFDGLQHRLKTCLLDDKMDKIKKCLSLVGDADYLLLSYCRHLEMEDDHNKFNKIFNDMKAAIFENPFAQMSPNYQVLNIHKDKLYGIQYADKQKKNEILTNIIQQLNKCKKSDYVYLSRLCPTLTSAKEIEDERDTLSKLFRLKPGIYVVKFEEKIQLMTGSIRRPAILKCRLSNGRTLRCMVKRGEWVRIHCSAIAINTTLGLRGGYRITPLSDDCCLIEYLENHEPLRRVISSKYDIDIPEVNKRAKDDELILDRNRSLEEFQMLCKKIPSYLLRSAIEENSASVEDFICKKKIFLQSTCDMTVFSYFCGMSDRHLENMMYNKQDGGACHVDCAAILQDGAELPPARLTRNILALCDSQVLESRLQTKFLCLRENQHILISSISVAFKWMGDKYMEKFNHMRNLIQGKVLSHNITIEALSKSKQPNKEQYIQLLEEIFEDYTQKNEYTVEEQVSSLLRQSTDQRILSVTRSGWEPWI